MKHYNIVKKAVSAGLIVVLGTTLLTGCSEADTGEKETTAVQENDNYQIAAGSGFGYKDETVYVTTDGNGKVTDITVSEWLKNMDNIGELKDATNLTDIVNVKGNEEFEVSGGIVTFKTDGRDIYYQGKADAATELPVALDITYTLDGEKITAEELNGRSGHLVMTIEYKGLEKTKAVIGGEEKDIYVPFLAVTGMLLPSEKFDNVTIDNGTIISNGNYKIAAGYGIPGLAENFDAEETATVTVEADVKEYEVSMMMTMVTNSFLAEADTSELDDIIEKFISGFGELTGGVTQLDEGAGALSEGAAQLKDGAVKVNDGIMTVKKNLGTLSEGMSQAYIGSAALDEKVQELGAGAGKLQTGAAQLDAGVDKLVNEMNTLYSTINDTLEKYGSVIAQNKATIDSLNAAVAAGNSSAVTAETLAKIEGYYQMTGAYGALSELKKQLEATDENGRTVMENLALLAAGSEEMKNGTATLAAGAEQLYESGSKVLVEALKKLSEGSAALDNGMTELAIGSDSLAAGATELSAGAAELAAGIDKFVGKIPELIEKAEGMMSGNPEVMTGYMDEMIKAAREYKSFTDLDNSQNGEVKFIIKTK